MLLRVVCVVESRWVRVDSFLSVGVDLLFVFSRLGPGLSLCSEIRTCVFGVSVFGGLGIWLFGSVFFLCLRRDGVNKRCGF